ncbi:MAG: RNA polymerase sigma factor [Candidatus Kapabacteria bacterium]|nr:RNA polymerase sigma factor [Ignavibacteriota bacterium]MCW5885089.1 RNA polymerase sigma factor [Candidatus Kapabacteria bacterium]
MTESEKKTEFMKLYDEVHTPLLRFARAMTKSREDARDLASETILIAYEKFHTIKNKQAFLSYLFSIATRIHKRRRWRMRLFSEYDETKAEQIIANISPPDLSTDVEILYNALDKLPEKIKTALILFEISGLSIEEIRDIQGGSLSGVKSRLSRGRVMLKEILTDDYSNNFNYVCSNNGVLADQKSISAGVL